VTIKFAYWLLPEVGDYVERDEELATIETDKVISNALWDRQTAD
jgi:glycine cleavage system H lipoate-binding protein